MDDDRGPETASQTPQEDAAAPLLPTAQRFVLSYASPGERRRWRRMLRYLPRVTWVALAFIALATAAGWWFARNAAPWRVEQTIAGWLTDWDHSVSSDGTRVLVSHPKGRRYPGYPPQWGVVKAFSVCDLRTGQELWNYQGDADVRWARWSPDGERIIACFGSKPPQLIDARIGKQIPLPTGRAKAVAFSPDGSLFAIAGTRGGSSVHRSRDGALVHQLDQWTVGPTEAAAFSRDGSRVVFRLSGPNNRDLIWLHACDVRDGKPLLTGAVDTSSPDLRDQLRTKLAALDLLDTEVVGEWLALPGVREIEEAAGASTTSVSPANGARIVTSSERYLGVWDRKSGQRINWVAGLWLQASWSPDGKRLLVRGRTAPNEPWEYCQVWDPDLSSPLWVLPDYAWVGAHWLSGDRMLTQRDNGTIHVWHRVRPEPWWGVAVRWEFWVAAILAVLALRRTIRDLRAWYGKAPWRHHATKG